MKLMWLGYLVYSLGNCVMNLYIETGLQNFIFSWALLVQTEKHRYDPQVPTDPDDAG
jgi:hypothetical protein